MNVDEIYERIQRCPYYFDEDDLKGFNPEDSILIGDYEDGDLLCCDTPMIAWIRKWHTLPQKELLHDPLIRDASNRTPAMVWIEECKSLPPMELLHNMR